MGDLRFKIRVRVFQAAVRKYLPILIVPYFIKGPLHPPGTNIRRENIYFHESVKSVPFFAVSLKVQKSVKSVWYSPSTLLPPVEVLISDLSQVPYLELHLRIGIPHNIFIVTAVWCLRVKVFRIAKSIRLFWSGNRLPILRRRIFVRSALRSVSFL